MKYEQPEMEILELMNVCICQVSSGGNTTGNDNDTNIDDDMFGN